MMRRRTIRRPPTRRGRGNGLGQAHLDFNTRELHQIGQAVLEVALPGAVALAEEAQEDGFDSSEKSELLEIVAGPTQDRNKLDASDYYEEPRSVGIDFVRELEDRGFRIVRAR